MKLIAYLIDTHRVDIRPAPVERAWMDATDQRYAYRCLPLNIANGHGWEILCPSGFSAIWDGRSAIEAIDIRPDPGTQAPAISHFSSGILTFHIPCLFRTEPGFDLMAGGPINRPKDGIAALSGIIETDWAPYTFTMNWLFTRPHHEVRFEQGEPFCHFFPVRRGEVEAVQPQFRAIADDPETARQYAEWHDSRRRFNRELKEPGSQARAERWQKLYYRGLAPDGEEAVIEDHRTRLRVRPFAK
jgi:hypothetical protein